MGLEESPYRSRGLCVRELCEGVGTEAAMSGHRPLPPKGLIIKTLVLVVRDTACEESPR